VDFRTEMVDVIKKRLEKAEASSLLALIGGGR
jgi:hypothetical protein